MSNDYKIPLWQCAILLILALLVPFLIGQMIDGDIEIHKHILTLMNGRTW